MRYDHDLMLKRDKELTRFKRFAVENQDLMVQQIVDQFEFIYIDAKKDRHVLYNIAHEAMRHPHRIPKI